MKKISSKFEDIFMGVLQSCLQALMTANGSSLFREVGTTEKKIAVKISKFGKIVRKNIKPGDAK